MDDELAEAVRQALDDALAGAEPNVGVAFGLTLFNEFHRRGWFTLERFGALGSNFQAIEVPAYNRTHFAFATWGLGENEFAVGKSNA